MLNVVLEFLGKLFRRCVACCKYDSCLNYLASDGVRCCGDRTLYYCRMLDERTFYFERSDTVTGTFDNVIVTSYEPVISVVVSPCNVLKIVVAAAESFVG